MINKETIISVYNEKLTLLQWLKSVNKALDEAVLTNVEIEQRGNATFVFVFTFEDGTQVESNEIIVNQGESINGASIVNGHLILTLTNGDELDAGNVKPVSSFGFNSSRHLIVYYGDGTNQDLGLIKGVSGFSINESQHLIVTYDNGTIEDLGAIFDGDINISGNFSVSGTTTLQNVNGNNITGNSIIENMNIYQYAYAPHTKENVTITPIYVSMCKNGNKLTLVWFGTIRRTGTIENNFFNLGQFSIPSAVGTKLIPTALSGLNVIYSKLIQGFATTGTSVNLAGHVYKSSDTQLQIYCYNASNLVENTTYQFRYEATFLLGSNLAS